MGVTAQFFVDFKTLLGWLTIWLGGPDFVQLVKSCNTANEAME